MKVRQLYNRLRVRCYKPSDLKPLFQRATENALQHNIPSTPQAASDEPVIFFHVQYHPNGPPSRDIQQTWRDTIYEPPQCRTLASYGSHNEPPIELRRMIVCYNRAQNLGSLLSYWKINTGTGPPVSSYRLQTMRDHDIYIYRERERDRERERRKWIDPQNQKWIVPQKQKMDRSTKTKTKKSFHRETNGKVR
jgi:hypothetical protein